MVTVPCNHSLASRLSALPLFLHPNPLLTNSPPRRRRPSPFPGRRLQAPLRIDAVIDPDSSSSFSNPEQKQQQLKTLFPGGFKRPEIKVPTLALQVSVAELLDVEGSAKEIDVALSRGAGMVVLETGGETGARLYEAACSLKSLVGDRAYFLIAERVDIAAAVGASGVVLSDDAIPALIARKMMMKAKSDSVYLPLVARIVQNTNSALLASSSEGADFLIMTISTDSSSDIHANSVIQDVKIPIFFILTNLPGDSPWAVASKLLETGACGIVMSSSGTKHLSDDILRNIFIKDYLANGFVQDKYSEFPKKKKDSEVVINGEKGFSGFTKIDERVVQLIEAEKLLIHEVVAVIQKAAPMMKEVSLLIDAASRLSEPFLLVIVGEFNSGKSTVVNALLGRKYLKEGVIPTTNEITLLSYSDVESDYQNRCERNPDGQFICYLSAPILKEMNLVDTPGTNVILQRQQRLTEEFVPRADLIFFVISADRPLTESEVDFLQYVQQWKKKVIFVLNKLDLYRNDSELQEATEFVIGNAVKLLGTEEIKLFPVSARSALEAKLSSSLYDGTKYEELLLNDPRWLSSRFYELEDFLFSFMDGSTETGMERVRLKLESPVGIVDRLLSSCERFVKQSYQSANQDLVSIMKVRSSVNDYASRVENESISWRKQASSLIETAKTRAVKLMESILQLSNTDLVSTYSFRGEKSGSIVTISAVQNEIIGPAISDAQELIREFLVWLESTNSREGELYIEQFEKEWQELVGKEHALQPHTYKLLGEEENLSLKVMENFKASAAAKLFEQEIREVLSYMPDYSIRHSPLKIMEGPLEEKTLEDVRYVSSDRPSLGFISKALGTFGGLGAAGLSASLLTSVLPTTLEDLLALALCSAGGYIAISSFPARRKVAIAKLQRVADTLANELENAMKKDLLLSVEKLDRFVQTVSEPYIEAAQNRIDQLEKIQAELEQVEQKFKALKYEIQNIHLS